jgi:hypothetical protein
MNVAAVTAAVVGATVGAASLVNTIEQQNQSTRRSNQALNAANSDADKAIAAQNQADGVATNQRAANAARTAQRNRVVGVSGQPAAPSLLGATTGPAVTQPSTPGNNSLIGS